MSDDPASWIHAFKPHERGLIACEISDPEANRFDIHWLGAAYSSTCITVEKRYLAEQISYAIENAFEAGKRRKLAELRNFLGIHQR